MERQRDEASRADRRASRKKDYVSPELQEWGSIQDLTQGNGVGGQDFPKKGGSRPV